jgi:hypothetical protein
LWEVASFAMYSTIYLIALERKYCPEDVLWVIFGSAMAVLVLIACLTNHKVMSTGIWIIISVCGVVATVAGVSVCIIIMNKELQAMLFLAVATIFVIVRYTSYYSRLDLFTALLSQLIFGIALFAVLYLSPGLIGG